MTVKTKALAFEGVKAKAIAGVVALVSAVALPQLFHLLGAVSGLGTSLGETLLPMHIAIFAAGFLAGPVVGVIAGLLCPVISYFLTGMPAAAMLPYMMIEIAVYGLSSGLLAKFKMPTFLKLLAAQIAGRGVRAAAIAVGFYAFNSPVGIAVIWNSIVTGLPGIALQWALIPLMVFFFENQQK